MSIKLKNTGEFLVALSAPGAASVGAKFSFLVPFACQLKAVFGKVRTAGVTGTQNSDIQKNGVSIFSGAGKVDFASGATAAAYGPLSANPTQFVKGDIITLNITAINTTPAVDTSILLVLQRLRGTGPVGAMVTDSVGAEAE